MLFWSQFQYNCCSLEDNIPFLNYCSKGSFLSLSFSSLIMMHFCIHVWYLCMYICMNLSISPFVFEIAEILESSTGYNPSFWQIFWSLSLYILLLLWFSAYSSLEFPLYIHWKCMSFMLLKRFFFLFPYFLFSFNLDTFYWPILWLVIHLFWCI